MVLVLFCFLFINTYGKERIYTNLRNETTNRLYSEASSIDEEYKKSYNSEKHSEQDIKSLESDFKIAGSVSATNIMILDSRGKIIINTSESDIEGKNVSDYSKDFLGNQTYEGNALDKLISGENLFIIYPLSSDMKITGYIVTYKSTDDLHGKADDYCMKLIMGVVFIMAFTFFILLILYISFKVSLNRITESAVEFAKGHFDHKMGKKPRNDFFELYNSLSYIAMKTGNMQNDQKKFIADVSHDFRSPLTSIKGYTEAMADGTIPPELHEKYLNIILFETERLTKLTNNLLELNNFENTGLRIEYSDFDINSTIKMVSREFENRCSKKNITFDLTFSSKVLYVHADIYKIEQVIQNLIDNAVKFSHHNSMIYISTTTNGSKAFISVKDTGIGIPQESQSKIWDKFYKTDLSRGKDKTGSGLGLSIVKEIIDAHGENINVISTEGAGTEFVFSLKLSENRKS